MAFDVSALKKYDVSGPRYTSYPTAPVFHEQYTWDQHQQDFKERCVDRPLSLYFHLPYCDSLCYFCGCHMKVSNDRTVVASYLDLLKKEIKQKKKYLEGSLVRQMHWGGGTPTHLTPDEIRDLGFFIKDNFKFAPDAECGVEIDPREISYDTIKALREAGFNRASMGIQDFDLNVQKAVNRVHSFELISEVVGWIRQEKFQSLNLDLIYGLPHQSVESFAQTIYQCLELDPDRFAVFNFAYLPHMIKHQKTISKETLPSPQEKLKIFESAGNVLTDAGYVFVGMDHFAKENDSLVISQRNKTLQRNFQGYSTHGGLDLIAFGASGISQLEDSYAQNIKEINRWRQAVASHESVIERGLKLTEEDQQRRDLIFTLLCHFQLDIKDFERKWGMNFSQKYHRELKSLGPFVDDQCLYIDDDLIRVTDKGYLIIRNIVMVFDAYIDQLRQKGSTFSRTV